MDGVHCDDGRRLTDKQVQSARIEIALDMLALVLKDNTSLPRSTQKRLRSINAGLASVQDDLKIQNQLD